MITADEIKTFLNINDAPNSAIESAIADAYEYLARKNLPADGDNATTKALKYLTAYYLLPRISFISGNKGVFKQIGVGDNAQQLISDADVIRRQEFYWREATLIINEIGRASCRERV